MTLGTIKPFTLSSTLCANSATDFPGDRSHEMARLLVQMRKGWTRRNAV